MYNFKGKVALVTGSSTGIGEAIVTELARYGAQVTVNGLNREDVESVAEKCRQISPDGKMEPLQIVGDLTKDETLERLLNETVEKFGKLDILVNNAGVIDTTNGFEDVDKLMKGYDFTFNVNVRVPLKLTAMAIPFLEKTKGVVIQTCSIASFKPWSYMSYAMSKAALDMFTKCSALELGNKGIRVNSINPGHISTPLSGNFFKEGMTTEDFEKSIAPYTLVGRIGKPIDCAQMVCYLVSDQASFITGASFVVDGGMSLKV